MTVGEENFQPEPVVPIYQSGNGYIPVVTTEYTSVPIDENNECCKGVDANLPVVAENNDNSFNTSSISLNGEWSYAQTFHIISASFAVLSFLFTLLEIVPLIFLFAWWKKIFVIHNQKEASFLLLNTIITLLMMGYEGISFIMCVVFSFGACLVFIVFLLPIIFVSGALIQLYKSQKSGTLPFGPSPVLFTFPTCQRVQELPTTEAFSPINTSSETTTTCDIVV